MGDESADIAREAA